MSEGGDESRAANKESLYSYRRVCNWDCDDVSNWMKGGLFKISPLLSVDIVILHLTITLALNDNLSLLVIALVQSAVSVIVNTCHNVVLSVFVFSVMLH